MYLSRSILKNYRSIKELDLRFEKGKNVIVGRNNSGKSNIIKAIDLMLGESAPAYDKAENITENDFYNGNTTQEILIFCELTRDKDEELNYDELYKCYGFKIHSKIESWENRKPIKKPIRIPLPYSDINQFFTNLKSVFDISEDSESDYINPKLRNQKTFENQFSDKYRFALVFLAFKNQEEKICKNIRFLYREDDNAEWIMSFSATIRNELLRSAIIPSFRDPQNQLRISDWGWYGKLLKKYVNPDNKKLKEAFMQVKDASNEVFLNLQEKINNSKVKIAFPNTNISFQFNPDTRQDVHKSALIYVDDGFKSKLQDKGSGIQSAVIIGLFHFYTREIAHVGSSLLAIEEPELYLHPHGRRVISNRLNDFLEGNKNQVIISTHSSEFINSPNENLNIIVVSKDAKKGTCAQNVSFATAKEKQILIKSQNTEMFFADLVILVEGGGDKYILESIAEGYGAKNDKLGKNWLNDNNISVVPVTGKTEFWKYAQKLDQVKIKWNLLADYDFFKEGLGDFLTKMEFDSLKDEHNGINGKINQGDIKDIDLLEEKIKQKIVAFLVKLKKKNIFILKGELESYYTEEAKKVISGLSGKEEKALHVVTQALEDNKSIDTYIKTEEYKEFLDLVCQNLNK